MGYFFCDFFKITKGKVSGLIKFDHVYKTFSTKVGQIQALKDVSLTVKKGEIFGVIGYSGAGKSTLIRLVNGLERHEEGIVAIDGQDISLLSDKALNKLRKRIGMVFQQFNLLETQSVYRNIEIPLILAGMNNKEIDARVRELLSFVGLEDKYDAHASSLSGGQKQRVGIARALANQPDILLCDEATSALDPDTTDSILKLLKRINKELGITILLITHEMGVIQQICDSVAVMKEGAIIEQGAVSNVFSQPQQAATKNFVNTVIDNRIPKTTLEQLDPTSNIIKLSYFHDFNNSSLLYELNRRFTVKTDILGASVNELQGKVLDIFTLKLDGDTDEVDSMINYIESQDIKVERVSIND